MNIFFPSLEVFLRINFLGWGAKWACWYKCQWAVFKFLIYSQTTFQKPIMKGCKFAKEPILPQFLRTELFYLFFNVYSFSRCKACVFLIYILLPLLTDEVNISLVVYLLRFLMRKFSVPKFCPIIYWECNSFSTSLNAFKKVINPSPTLCAFPQPIYTGVSFPWYWKASLGDIAQSHVGSESALALWN